MLRLNSHRACVRSVFGSSCLSFRQNVLQIDSIFCITHTAALVSTGTFEFHNINIYIFFIAISINVTHSSNLTLHVFRG